MKYEGFSSTQENIGECIHKKTPNYWKLDETRFVSLS